MHQQIPATTSPKPATIFLHQRKPVLHQRPSIQRIPVLYQLSRPAPATWSCSNDHHPSAAIVRRTLFRFTIRHNKVWPFKATALFCHSYLVRCQSLIFQKFADLRNTTNDWRITNTKNPSQVDPVKLQKWIVIQNRLTDKKHSFNCSTARGECRGEVRANSSVFEDDIE